MSYADWAKRFWKQPLDHISAARLEVEQRSSVSRHTPSVMLANLCNVLVFLLDLWGAPRFTDAVYWATAVLGVAGYIYFGRRRQRPGNHSSGHVSRRAIINALALGSCWAALPLFFFQDAAPGTQLLIACLCAGMLCGGAFALAGIPMAAVAFSGPIAIASCVALAQSGDKDHILIAVVLGVYTAVLFKGVFAYAEQLRTRVLTQIDTEQKARERTRTIQATGLNAMGGMASGLAHEIKQPLSACGAYLATARRLADMRPEARSVNIEEVLDRALEQNQRAGEIVGNLRDFIMRGEPNRSYLNLRGLIEDALLVAISDEDEENYDVSLRFDAESDRIFADKVQIRQVLVNLIRNAVEAMDVSTKRELTISSSVIDEGAIRVDIADTGPGLAEVLKSDPFEPFLTTKAGGMGIGLAICRAIIEAHQGTIWTQSNPGGGAVFSFILPLTTEEKHH